MQSLSVQTQTSQQTLQPQSFVQLFVWQHNPNIRSGSTSLQTVKAIPLEEWKQVNFRCQSGFHRPSVFTFPANNLNWTDKMKQVWELIFKSKDFNAANPALYDGCYSIYIAIPLMEP